MGGSFSIQKGKRAEREVVNLLQPIIDKVYTAVRVENPELTMSPIPQLQRNTLQSDGGGYDLVGLEWMAIEVKRTEQLQLNSWWDQCVKQARITQTPVLIYRQNQKAWRVQTTGYLPCGDLRIKCRVDIDLQSFLVYFEHRVKFELLRLLTP